MKRYKTKSFKLLISFFGFIMLFNSLAYAGFDDWLQDFKQQALQQGISQATLDNTLSEVQFMPKVIAQDTSQPEFVVPFSVYVQQRVTPYSILKGQKLIRQHQALLQKIEKKYGVPPSILVALWGMETGYGRDKGNIYIPSALATLAYDGRRRTFFADQLMAALRLVQAGNIPTVALRGSWAGGMGHMQFIPSTLLEYGVDADADNHVDVWQSIPDAMTTAANYLESVDWIPNEPAAIEVILPHNFNWQDAQLSLRQPVEEWVATGVVTANGKPFPPVADDAAIILPQGWQGAAFMIFSNFDVIMEWNKSVNYALSVVQLASQYTDHTGILGGKNAQENALTFKQMIDLQACLNAHGYDMGNVDGFPGVKTQAAIRIYQAANGLPQDGYANTSLLARLQNIKGF